MVNGLDEETRTLIAKVESIATSAVAPNADRYDRQAAFPEAGFQALFEAKLHAPTIGTDYGGLGFGPHRGRALPLWLMTQALARGDLSFGRCWEGHANSLLILDGLASDEQKRRYFGGVIIRGERWAAWSGEPQTKATGEVTTFGTRVERVSGGYLIEGTKAFATSAGGAHWAILLVNTAGPGGARHAAVSPETQQLLACRLADPTVTVDGRWWDPIGMRATVSHAVSFERTFIPDDDVIGQPGQYLLEGWQTFFVPHYAASFLGAAEAAYAYARANLTPQGKGADPYVQHRIARMHVNLETARLWLAHVADLFERRMRAEAAVAGSCARHLIEHLALEVVEHTVRACGARSLNRPSPVERILRDLAIYVRHDNDDHVLASIGKAILGLQSDMSFYKP
jgi:alkylation response protein AidB-like acyl-CoA dehydrogenase